MNMSKVFKSSLGIKYPTLRDHPLHSGLKWLEGKTYDDGAEGLWRIHDNLYDLRAFIDRHPGGRDWIQLTKGTDITEAFESHHLHSTPVEILKTFYVKKASKPRNFPFTFNEKGFYKTLKRRITEKVATLPKQPAIRSAYIADVMLVTYLCTYFLAVYLKSLVLGFISGICLALLAIIAHNFFHKKDNFRRYYFDLCMMSSKEWRISHVLSHHMYTNTISDMEISSLEPFLQYLPGEKNMLVRYGSWLYSPVIFAVLFFGHYIKTLISDYKNVSWTYILPFVPLVLTWCFLNQSTLCCLSFFFWIITVASIYFGIVGTNAAHHHPEIFHDGDSSRNPELDWGIFQLVAVMDRKDITGSHFLVLTNFGDHALHHLFPTIDHGLLEHLYPVFLETCKEFDLEWRLESQIELVKGQYMQLARMNCN
ncbi:hypothetical protein ABEB36_009832 [Hypothenemus hampei]|uniref:Cytochrome b5-related protein n=1 Tax=Hypothenemus hampei TaxID=57062 RepID=A0ABD1EJS2_HYPHA